MEEEAFYNFLLRFKNESLKPMFINNPICTLEFYVNWIKINKIKREDCINIKNIAYPVFKKEMHGKRTCIDIDTLYWTEFFIGVCKKQIITISENYPNLKLREKIKIIFNNGCCRSSECPFYIYFQIIVDVINSSISNE